MPAPLPIADGEAVEARGVEGEGGAFQLRQVLGLESGAVAGPRAGRPVGPSAASSRAARRRAGGLAVVVAVVAVVSDRAYDDATPSASSATTTVPAPLVRNAAAYADVPRGLVRPLPRGRRSEEFCANFPRDGGG